MEIVAPIVERSVLEEIGVREGWDCEGFSFISSGETDCRHLMCVASGRVRWEGERSEIPSRTFSERNWAGFVGKEKGREGKWG